MEDSQQSQSVSILHERKDLMVLQAFPSLQSAQFNENGNFDDLALESLKQVERGANGSARGENVIDQHDT